MARVQKLVCVLCGLEHREEDFVYTCRRCGPEGILEVVLDERQMAESLTHAWFRNHDDESMWRYLPALPLHGVAGIQPLHAGWTPLYRTNAFERDFGIRDLWIKDDSRNPTGSLKDRASAVAVARAIEWKRQTVCAASTGNAASSLAGFAACAGLKSYIFVPETAPEAKVAQLLVFGATVFLVKGSYDDAVRLCSKAADAFGWYNRSCAINPYLVEGKKTVAWEICEQLHWEAPDLVFVAVGDGCTVAAVGKGLLECHRLGLIRQLPRIVGVQASGADPVLLAFRADSESFVPMTPHTLADSIAVGVPRNGVKALRAIRATDGDMVAVEDSEILAAMRLLAGRTGVFGEPAGVTAFAGLLRMKREGRLRGDERIAVLVTGSGLKDVKSAMAACAPAIRIAPDLDEVRRVVEAEE